MSPADLSPLPGWRELERRHRGTHRSFVSGDPTGDRLRVAYFLDGDGQRVARVWFGPLAEGPPGHAHGGSIAAVLDETMGANCWQQGHRVVAGNLQVTFRRPLPLGTSAVVRAGIGSVDGRKVQAVARIEDVGGQVFAEASGVFVILREEAQQAFLDAMADGTYRAPEAY